MPLARNRKPASRDARWYENQRHANQRLNDMLFDTPGWYYCDPDSFYRAMFPEGFLQKEDGSRDGKPNAIVIEDTGQEREYTDENGQPRSKRVMHRYTVHDDLDLLEELRDVSIEKNTFMFLSPISYYGKSRDHRNARYLHAFMIDLDYVGERELANLLHQMERGVIPYANYLVTSGTGLHVVYMLKEPIPLMTRYVGGLQAIKRALTDRVWNAHTSASDPDKKQYQGIFQGFRMVGTPTKLNGDIGNPKTKQPYVVGAFSHDATPRATISYLLSFIPKLKDMAGMDDLMAVSELSESANKRTPLKEAKELWPEWYENTVVKGKPRGGWLYGRVGYDDCLKAISEQASVSHRYWCIFYLAVMANKCGVSYEELEEDAYGLLDQFDALSIDPSNRFTAKDVAAALEAYEGGDASGRSRRYTRAFCERHSAVTWERRGTKQNPPEKRLPPAETLAKARAVRDLHQKVKGTNWWDNGNRDGAPTKAMQVWEVAYEHPDMSHTAIAREAGVSRPTAIKWLSVEDWRGRYEFELRVRENEKRRAEAEFRSKMDERAGWRDERREYLSDLFGSATPSDIAILETVADNPGKSYEEVAVLCGAPDGESVRRIIDGNRELFNHMLVDVEEEPREGGESDTGILKFISYHQDMDDDQIARELGVPVSTVARERDGVEFNPRMPGVWSIDGGIYADTPYRLDESMLEPYSSIDGYDPDYTIVLDDGDVY